MKWCENIAVFFLRTPLILSIEKDVMFQLVVAFVLSRIDYCNAVLAALPLSTIELLQRAQNAAARLVFGLRSHDHMIHITPAQAQLHWLPVQFRIKFKLCLLMHQIHVGRCPAYLAELVSSSAENTSLRSTSSSGHSNPDCVQNSLNVPFLSPDLQNVCRVTFRW